MRSVVLVHLHPDFRDPLVTLLKGWNAVQKTYSFLTLRPRPDLERILLTPGAIANEEASSVAAAIRSSAGHPSSHAIVVFTEKRLYDDSYDQLLVGGRQANESPPAIGILSLDFLRKLPAKHGLPVLFGAITLNILYVLGLDCGLPYHDDTRGCIMDFCEYMPDIQIGLRDGLLFCRSCADALKDRDHGDLLALAQFGRQEMRIPSIDEMVTESIRLRGERYAKLDHAFDYDVALSFAGDDRSYAEELATGLRQAGVKVFYDRFDQGTLWGKNLHSYLSELYRLRAKYCVILLSRHYGNSRWTKVELNAALSREFEEEGKDYLLPIRLEDCEFPEIPNAVCYLKWQDYSVGDFVKLIVEKLAAQPLDGIIEPPDAVMR